MTLSARLEDHFGVPLSHLSPLSGGCVGDVSLARMSDGQEIVVKHGPPGSSLDIEGAMLVYLAEQSCLPVPDVYLSEDDLLVMEALPSGGALTASAQAMAAPLIAALHNISAPQFGLPFDTLIGGLPQSNKPTQSWIAFFRDERLLNMANKAHQAGPLPTTLLARIERLAGHLERWLKEPAQPSLIHGDLWGGNILAKDGEITGFIDPAIYYADPEIELAFSTLFGTFGPDFFEPYHEIRPIAPGFFEERRDLYNLYPLLVHVRLFGGSYVGSVDRTLSQFGF